MVVGNNPDELVKKYDLDTKVKPYVKMKRSEAAKRQAIHLKFIENLLTTNQIVLSDRQREIYKDLYLDIQDMDEAMYFEAFTEGCTYDEKTGDALSTENPNAKYQHACNPQKRLDASGEEHDMINPFILLPEEDNTEKENDEDEISYQARKCEIDWDRMHLYNTALYYRVWALCVDDEEPISPQEETIKERMKERQDYFANFKNDDEYVNHSCSFWCYGYLDENGYKELDYTISDKEWVATFYEKFVEPLKDDDYISLYLVRAID